MRVVPQVMSIFILRSNKATLTMTTIILGVTGDVLSLFNKIPFMIHLFLLVLFKLECEAVVLSVSLFDNYIHTAFCHSCSAITLFDISRS